MQMIKIGNAQLWVHDQQEALDFYTHKVGMEVRSDVTLPEIGDFRWLVGLAGGSGRRRDRAHGCPGPPMMDDATADQVRDLMGKGFAGTISWSPRTAGPVMRNSQREGSNSSRSPKSVRTGSMRPSAIRPATTFGSLRCTTSAEVSGFGVATAT